MKSFLRKVRMAISGIYCYICGHFIAWKHRYNKSLLTGKWFAGRLNGLCSNGWRWVVEDYKSCRRLKVNCGVPWPVSPRITVIGHENIHFHPDDLKNFQSFGCYFQGIGSITIGRGTYIAPNVGLITANHALENPDEHLPPKPVVLGEKCWIGMNSVILPGVELGPHTVVGAGSVVTKSFPKGYCVIAGNPAKFIKEINILEEKSHEQDEYEGKPAEKD